MWKNAPRRTALRSAGVAIGVGLAGCISSVTHNSSGVECQSDGLPQPTPNAEDLNPRDYPEYPDTISEESARNFAWEFERAYRVNSFLANGATGYDEIHVLGGVVEDWGVKQVENGYIIGIKGDVKTADTQRPPNSTGTERPSGTEAFGVWYEISTKQARRLERGQSVEQSVTPSMEEGATICTRG